MAKSASALETPMMRQYLAAKSEHPDCLLFMRMGDFYELFLDDAKEAARVLGIALTARNKGAADEVPMAGVPHHSLQQHLPKLLAGGYKVAVMDQLEDPSSSKGLVKRGLTRIITAGTLLDEDSLPDGAANYLVTCTGLAGPIGVAALDCSTGRFTVEEAADEIELGLLLARLQPAELVVPDELAGDDDALARLARCCDGEPPPVAGLDPYAWKPRDAQRILCERLAVDALDGFGIQPDEGHLIAAAAAALRYAESRAYTALQHVRQLRRLHRGAHLVLDGNCRRHLEILRNTADGSRRGSLLGCIDRCRSAPGSRLLADWLCQPLALVDPIRARHRAVGFLVDDDALRDDLRAALDEVYDLERLLARVATGRCHARDLVQLVGSLRAAERVRDALRDAQPPPLLTDLLADLEPDRVLLLRIEETLVDDPPLSTAEGGMLRDGVDRELDELRALRSGAGEWLARYQAEEAERSGIPKIKVGYNKVFGYYLEISKAHADKAPTHYVRKQTLVNAERYITPELKDYEDRALSAEEHIRSIESRIFAELRETVAEALPAIQACAHALAAIDVLAAMAEVARLEQWCRPEVDDGALLELRNARHPVVEAVLGSGRFVGNDTLLAAGLDGETDDGPGQLALITGPNMAGKSTYIRQVALAVILAQAGAFVPAEYARIGVVDRLFTRVGAGDELARNMSTFMVEMAETAAILNNASRRSLVVLDEVGRGTSTFDGLSLAWAITEHLHDAVGCRCLFATHYHELTDLASQRPGVRNYTVQVAEQDDEVVFLHRIIAGAATKSYGIHVARLAGVPQSVLGRARQVLATLEELNCSLRSREGQSAQAEDDGFQLSIFEPERNPALDRLRALDPDTLSPREALDELYQLITQAKRPS